MARKAIWFVCGAWFLAMLMFAGLGVWLLDVGAPMVDFMLGRSVGSAEAVATEEPTGAATANAPIVIIEGAADGEKRASEEGWGPGMALSAPE